MARKLNLKTIERRARLISGILLFVFLVSHLSNHSLGLISLEALDGGRNVFLAIWRNPIGTTVIVGSLIVHITLSYIAFLRRRSLKMSLWEALQVGFALAMPLLLAGHFAGTVYANARFDINDTYTYVIRSSWGDFAWNGVMLAAGLIVIWAHGCISLHYWLRLKPGYSRYQVWLFAAAILLPAAALTGFLATGREMAVLAQDSAWLRAEYARMALPRPFAPVVENIYGVAAGIRWVVVALIVAGLGVHGLRFILGRRRKRITISYPDGRRVNVEPGVSVLDASRLAGVGHASVCGGRGRCSTCRVSVDQGMAALPAADTEEQKVLNRIGAGPNVRLACQLKPVADLAVTPLLPPTATPKDGFRRPKYLQGTEREIAILFADLRSFTKFSEAKLPFDVVFALNQYFRVMGTAVENAGGRLDKFIGDGVMALFGIEKGLEAGCRDALKAAEAMADALDELNDQLKEDLDEPLRMGIGIHAGPAIVGEMGFRQAVSVTAVGDTVNTASRLETATKEFTAQLVLSEDVARASGLDFAAVRAERIEVRGKSEPLPIYVLNDARDLPAAD